MSRRFTKKRVLVTLVVVLAMALSATAIAYFTTSGSGSGSASVGTSTAVTVTGDPTGTFYPGGSLPVTTVIHNGATYPQYVKSLTVTISVSNAYDATSNPTGCNAADFTYYADSDGAGTAANPRTTDVSTDIAASSTKSVAGHVVMADTGSNQDGCKNATVTLTYAANAS